MNNQYLITILGIAIILVFYFGVYKKNRKSKIEKEIPREKEVSSNGLHSKMNEITEASRNDGDKNGSVKVSAIEKFENNVSLNPNTTKTIKDIHLEASFMRNERREKNLPLPKGDVELSEELSKILVDNYKDTNFSWLIPAATSFTEDGKLRVLFSTISYIASELKPIMLPGGTMRVLNLLTTEEAINLTLATGQPFYVKDRKTRIVTKFTKQMVEDLIIDLDFETDKIIKIKDEEISILQEKLNKNHEKQNQIKDGANNLLEANKKINSAYDESLKTIDKEREKYNELNELFIKFKRDSQLQSKKEQLHISELEQQLDSAKQKNKNEANSNKINTTAIPSREADKKELENKDDESSSTSSKKCLKHDFFGFVVKHIKDAILINTTAELRETIGLITINVMPNKNRALIFDVKKINSFSKLWLADNNCEGNSFKLPEKLKYISNEKCLCFYSGAVVTIFLESKDIKPLDWAVVLSEAEFKNIKNHTNSELMQYISTCEVLPIEEYKNKEDIDDE